MQLLSQCQIVWEGWDSSEQRENIGISFSTFTWRVRGAGGPGLGNESVAMGSNWERAHHAPREELIPIIPPKPALWGF